MKEATLKQDPNVKIPAAVKAAAERSEQLHRSLRDNPEPVEEEKATQEGSDDESKANPELDAKALADQKPEGKAEPQKVASEEKPKDEKAAKAEKSVAPADEETLEHKYKSLLGRYSRSQEQLRTLADEVQNLRGTLAAMQSAPPELKAREEANPELDPEAMITPEEADDYGEDFLKIVGKRARQEVSRVTKAYQDEINQLKKQLEGVSGFVKQDQQSKLLSTLDAQLPAWRKLNSNEDFLDWLSLPDPYSGAIRHDMLKAAYAQGNAHRVLAFFNGFLAEEAAVAPATEEPPLGKPTQPKVPLESLAAPGRAKTAASTPAPAEKPILSRAQIAAFYAEVAAGKFRGRDDEKASAEKVIFEAQREGRIR